MSTQEVSDEEVERNYQNFRNNLDLILDSYRNKATRLSHVCHNFCQEVDHLVNCFFPDSLTLIGHIVSITVDLDNNPTVTINKKLIREYLEMTRSTITVNVIE